MAATSPPITLNPKDLCAHGPPLPNPTTVRQWFKTTSGNLSLLPDNGTVHIYRFESGQPSTTTSTCSTYQAPTTPGTETSQPVPITLDPLQPYQSLNSQIELAFLQNTPDIHSINLNYQKAGTFEMEVTITGQNLKFYDFSQAFQSGFLNSLDAEHPNLSSVKLGAGKLPKPKAPTKAVEKTEEIMLEPVDPITILEPEVQAHVVVYAKKSMVAASEDDRTAIVSIGLERDKTEEEWKQKIDTLQAAKDVTEQLTQGDPDDANDVKGSDDLPLGDVVDPSAYNPSLDQQGDLWETIDATVDNIGSLKSLVQFYFNMMMAYNPDYVSLPTGNGDSIDVNDDTGWDLYKQAVTSGDAANWFYQPDSTMSGNWYIPLPDEWRKDGGLLDQMMEKGDDLNELKQFGIEVPSEVIAAGGVDCDTYEFMSETPITYNSAPLRLLYNIVYSNHNSDLNETNVDVLGGFLKDGCDLGGTDGKTETPTARDVYRAFNKSKVNLNVPDLVFKGDSSAHRAYQLIRNVDGLLSQRPGKKLIEPIIGEFVTKIWDKLSSDYLSTSSAAKKSFQDRLTNAVVQAGDAMFSVPLSYDQITKGEEMTSFTSLKKFDGKKGEGNVPTGIFVGTKIQQAVPYAASKEFVKAFVQMVNHMIYQRTVVIGVAGRRSLSDTREDTFINSITRGVFKQLVLPNVDNLIAVGSQVQKGGGDAFAEVDPPLFAFIRDVLDSQLNLVPSAGFTMNMTPQTANQVKGGVPHTSVDSWKNRVKQLESYFYRATGIYNQAVERIETLVSETFVKTMVMRDERIANERAKMDNDLEIIMDQLARYEPGAPAANRQLKTDVTLFLQGYKAEVKKMQDALVKHKQAVVKAETQAATLRKKLESGERPTFDTAKVIAEIKRQRDAGQREATIVVTQALPIVWQYLDAVKDKIEYTNGRLASPDVNRESQEKVLNGLQQIRTDMEAERGKTASVQELYTRYVKGKREEIAFYLNVPLVRDKTRFEIFRDMQERGCPVGTMTTSDVGIWFPVKRMQNKGLYPKKKRKFFGGSDFSMVDFLTGRYLGPYKPGTNFSGVIVIAADPYEVLQTGPQDHWYYVDDRHNGESMEAYRMRIMKAYLDERDQEGSRNIGIIGKKDKKMVENIVRYALNTDEKKLDQATVMERLRTSDFKDGRTCILTYMGDGAGDLGVLTVIRRVIRSWILASMKDPSVPLDFLTKDYRAAPLLPEVSGEAPASTTEAPKESADSSAPVTGGGYSKTLPLLLLDYNPSRDLVVLLTNAFKHGVSF